MSARLIIRLPEAATDALDWAVMSADGGVLAHGDDTNAVDLPAGTVVSATIALVPSHLVHLRQLVIPARSARAAQEAAPFALEEFLAAPLETQRVVCGSPLGEGRYWVAALDHELAARWQALLERVAVRPVLAVPEAMLLQPEAGELAIAAEGGRVFWRYHDGEAERMGGCPDAVSSIVLPALAGRSGARTISLSGGQGHHYAALDGQRLRQAGPLDLRARAAGADMAMLKAAPPLFGTRLTAVVDWAAILRPWRLAAGLALSAGALALASVGVEAYWLSREAGRLEAASLDAFTQAFPDVRRVVNPRVQLAQRLREVEAVEGGSDLFLELSGALAGVMASAPQMEIMAVRFQADSAALSVTARYRDFADFEALRSAGETAGLVLEDAGARQGTDGVNGEFVVRWRE